MKRYCIPLVAIVFSATSVNAANSQLVPVEHQSTLATDGVVEAVTLNFESQNIQDSSQVSENSSSSSSLNANTNSSKWSAASVAQKIANFGAETEAKVGKYLRVQDWTVLGTHRVPEAKIRESIARVYEKENSGSGSQSELHPWAWNLSEADIRNEILRNPWVEDAKVNWNKFPVSAEISVVEADPWLIAQIGGHAWVVSRSGRPIQALEAIQDPKLAFELAELPRLDNIDHVAKESGANLGIGSRFQDALAQLRTYELEGGFPFPVERYSVSSEGGVEIFPADVNLPRVLVSSRERDQARIQLTALSQVLGDAKRRGATLRSIDLRFDGQAIVR